ncbi:MAG: hypothetical protein J6D47_03720 [Peptostreptococcaceae bacterium]|nr:hypothetical protein [Peptostreptococcaceae bacterium]
MSTLTKNYKLLKPGQTDAIDVDNFNSNFDTIDEVIFNKVDKVEGKSLSSNDYTNEDKQKVATITNKVDKIEGKSLSTNDYTNDDKEKVETITNKVDKIEGKILSSNDYTDEDKQKLSSLSNYTHPQTHLASMILFEDGETLQYKFDNNTLFKTEVTNPEE